MKSEEPNGTSIDLRHNNENDAGAQVNASLYKLAATFGPVSFPKGMPNYKQIAILENAERERSADGNFFVDGPDEERRREEKRNGDDNLSRLADIVAEEQQERDRWSRTQSTVGGVTKTGAEWVTFAKRLREDDELREQIIAAFRKRGMSEEEAERRYERVADVAEIAAIPESQRTEAQTHKYEQAQADPAFKQDMREANAQSELYAKPTVQAERSVGTGNPAVIPVTDAQPLLAVTSGPSF